MVVHAVQLDTRWHDAPANRTRVRELTAGVGAGAVVVLPEMFDVGFTGDVEVACVGAGDNDVFCADLARERGAFVLAGYAREKRNEAALFAPGGALVGRYAKVHPFTFGREPFAPGDGPRVFDAAGARLAPAVCYDLRFPELFRHATLGGGAEVFAVLANWPAKRAAHRRALCVARAIENGAWVVCVNRCGRDPNAEYDGGTCVVSPMGEVVAELGGEEGVLKCALDVEQARSWRASFGMLRDARDDLLSLSRYSGRGLG